MIIVITGDTGIGKTTVCRKLIEIAKNQGYTCGGILTYKSSNKDIVIEDIHSSSIENLASTQQHYKGHKEGKYFFNPDGINFGNQVIKRSLSSSLLIVDEIGHLELKGEGFNVILDMINEDKIELCVLVIRKQLVAEFTAKLPDALEFETTMDNRDQLPYEIGSVLSKCLVNEREFRNAVLSSNRK